MSIIESGISDIYSITAKIAELKNQATSGTANSPSAGSIDPKLALLNLQQNFNDMLSELISSSNDDEEDNKTDPLSFLNDQLQTNTTGSQTASSAASAAAAGLNVSSYTGLPDL